MNWNHWCCELHGLNRLCGAGGGGGGTTTQVVNVPAKTPEEIALDQVNLQIAKSQQQQLLVSFATSNPAAATAYLDKIQAGGTPAGPFAGLEALDTPDLRSALAMSQQATAQNQLTSQRNFDLQGRFADVLQQQVAMQTRGQNLQNMWQAQQGELQNQQFLSTQDWQRQQSAQANAALDLQRQQLGLNKAAQDQFNQQLAEFKAGQQQQAMLANAANAQYGQDVQAAQDLYQKQLANAQGITSPTPADQALIEQIYGGSQARAQQDLTRYLGETAAMRGLRVSDSPVADEAARQAGLLGLGLGSARAAAQLDLTQQSRQQLINQAQFNVSNSLQNAALRAQLAQQGVQFGVGATQQQSQFGQGLQLQQAGLGSQIGQFNLGLGTQAQLANQTFLESVRQFQEGLRQQAFQNRLALASAAPLSFNLAAQLAGQRFQGISQTTNQSLVPSFGNVAGGAGGLLVGLSSAKSSGLF